MTLVTTVNPSPNFYVGHSGPVVFIGIHTMEAPEAGTTAENVANYFKNPSVKASSHWCVDNNSRVRCVYDADSAWTMPPVNGQSMNVEMAGYAGQTPIQWDDAYSDAVLDNAAVCVAEWCHKFSIPVRHLTDDQIRTMQKGIVGHADVNRVFRASDHWDPGPNFPWSRFLGRVSVHLGNVPVAKPNCTALQSSVRATADNLWGPDTDKHCGALIAATPFGGQKFPYGIMFVQQVVGAHADGFWGPESKAALLATVKSVQSALRSMNFDPQGIDGIWGPNTNSAYSRARTACHI
jgi:N-acetylmuramoyl-L-alanine amidase